MTSGGDGLALGNFQSFDGAGVSLLRGANKPISSRLLSGFSIKSPTIFPIIWSNASVSSRFLLNPFFPTGQKGLEISVKIHDHIDKRLKSV
jgi:hypothetical protein